MPIYIECTRSGLVFLPTTSPSPDFYGGERLGANVYANSIVALRAATGEVVWYFQVVHHDLWDYDVPAQPVLVTMPVDGKPVPVYPNARHIVQRQDWAYFQQPEVKAERPVIGLCADPLEPAGLLDLIDGGKTISPGISTFLTPGHTPGHSGYLVHDPDGSLLIWGDTLHVAGLQPADPKTGLIYDADPQTAAITRRATLEQAARGDRLDAEPFKHRDAAHRARDRIPGCHGLRLY